MRASSRESAVCDALPSAARRSASRSAGFRRSGPGAGASPRPPAAPFPFPTTAAHLSSAFMQSPKSGSSGSVPTPPPAISIRHAPRSKVADTGRGSCPPNHACTAVKAARQRRSGWSRYAAWSPSRICSGGNASSGEAGRVAAGAAAGTGAGAGGSGGTTRAHQR